MSSITNSVGEQTNKFDWTKVFGSEPLIKDKSTISVSSLSDNDVVGIYFSAHWCGPCRSFTPKLCEAYSGMDPKTKCEIVFVSADRDKDAFSSYFGDMPFAALSYDENKVNSAINEKFECNGIPMLVFLNAKTGMEITKRGRGIVTSHGTKFAKVAFELVERKKAAMEKVKKLSFFEGAVTAKDGSDKMADLQHADVVAVAFGNPNNRGWSEYVKPALVETYDNIIGGNETTFEVVYHSESKSESANDLAHDKWGFLPNGVGADVFQAIGDVESPTVLVFKKNKANGFYEVLVEDAARTIYEMKDAAYPWSPDAIADAKKREKEKIEKEKEKVKDFEIFKGENVNIIDKDGNKVDITEMQGDADVVGLYFSAHWCGPCRGFTPKLAELYKACEADGKKFKVIFLSSDSNQAAFDEYFKEMPWYALEYKNRALKENLSNIFDVSGIPTLVLLKADGTEITKSGRNIVSVGAEFFPWGPEEMDAGHKAAQERAEREAKEELEKEKVFNAKVKADGEKVFRRIVGTPGNSPIQRSAANVYDVDFKRFDTFATDESYDSGKIYYEIEYLGGGGILQGGFADESFKAQGGGVGVGDDNHSWGFDGNRVCAWGNSTSKTYGKPWKHGDVLGCLADLDEKKIEFFLNGESMGEAFADVKVSGKMRIAVTAQGQKLRVNLGNDLKYSPLQKESNTA